MSEQKIKTVAGLSHAAIRTKNIPESIRFYTEVLGLEEAFRMNAEDGSLATVYLFLAPGQYLELFAGGAREGISGPDVPPESLQAQADARLAGGFRPMRRFRQQVSDAECIRILREETRGVLSMLGENGYPYGIPLNHWYNPEDGKLYFHGAKEGHKLDALRMNDRVSYCVYDAGYRKEGEWALNVTSVVVFGRITLVTDEKKAKKIGTNLCRKFTDDEAYIQKELQNALPRAQCLELTIDHMTGKLVNES